MKTQHTPGPLHVEKHNGEYEIWPKNKPEPHTNTGSARIESDAILYAAAPELLEALRALVNGSVSISSKGAKLFTQGDSEAFLSEHCPKVIAARAAIAKATGTP
jgi:hypothetical protein